jgi:CSLREA domain-containing protein
VEVDESGRVYVGMRAGSTGLATADGWDTTLSGTSDALVGVFSADGSQLLTASYVGGSGSEEVWDLVLDAENRPVMIGDTSSSDFPTLVGAYDRTLGGTWDMFVVRSTALPPPNVVIVNSTGDAADASPGNGVCSTGGTNSAGQPACTLRAAIQEANASAVVDTIEFDIPTTETGYSGGRGVFTITAGSSLPNFTAGVTIDGATQTANRGDTNPGVLGFVGSVGTGPDGVVGTGDEPSIDGVPAPEIEVVLAGHQGFVVDADAVTISGLAVYGGNRDMAIISGADTVIEDMVIGAFADSFTDPGLGVRSTGSAGIAVQGGSGAIIRNNLIGYQANRGVEVSGTLSDVTVSGNEIRGTSQVSVDEGGGIEIINFWAPPGSAATGVLVTGNLITDRVADYAVEVATAAGDSGIVVRDNTLSDIAPILVYGIQNGDGGEITNNVITGSAGHGVQISDVAGWTISQNSISDSTWIGIALYDGNDDLAAPTIDSAVSNSGTAQVDYTVTAAAGDYVVEFFDNSVAGDGGFGEGETYLGSDTIAHPGGTASYSHTVSEQEGDIVSATLTQDFGGGDLGSTSVFSNAFTVTQGALEPVVLDDIQKGVRTLPTGSTTVTVEIEPVDPDKAFLQFSVRGSGDAPSNMSLTGQLTDADTVTFARAGTAGDVVIDWAVVEFVSGVRVQRGGGSAEALNNDFPITSVDTSRSFPIISHRENGSVYDHDDFVRGHLTSSTNLRVIGPGGGVGNHVEWQVVEYNDASVHTGTVSMASGATSATATLPTFDTSQAWLLYTYSTESGTATNIGQKLVRGLVTNSTTLTFDRANTGTAIEVRYHLVEFTDATSVQHGSANLATAAATANVTIATVDPARSISGGGYMYTAGSSSYATDDVPGVAWATSRISTATNLRLTRSSTAAGADIGWFVVNWGGAGPDTVTVNSTDDDADLFPGDGYCDTGGVNASGHVECTLRAAIQEANASAVVDIVAFDIPAADANHSGGVWTFAPASAYPALSQSVTVDATTQPGHSTTPVISINGSGISGGPGLDVSGAGVTVRGLNVRSVPGDGVYVSGSGFTLEDSHIGTNAAGTAASANTLTGLLVAGPDATIQRNLISGNGSNGVRIQAGGDRARFVDNFIGTTVTGNAALPNGQEGLEIEEADDVVVGEPGLGNVISGNSFSGINGWAGDATGAVIQGNLIGVGADGVTALGNSTAVSEGGIAIRGPMHDWVIGGTGPGEGNVIANNLGGGVQLVDVNGAADDIAILGNTIHSNTGLGIDIDDDGVTANDANDADTGINDKLNFPVISSAVTGGRDGGRLLFARRPAGNYRIEFFANPSGADPRGTARVRCSCTPRRSVTPGWGQRGSRRRSPGRRGCDHGDGNRGSGLRVVRVDIGVLAGSDRRFCGGDGQLDR